VLKKRYEVKSKIGHKRVLAEQVVVTKKYQERLIRIAHEDMFAGHMGVNNTLRRLRRNFYWAGIRKDVVRFCNTCHVCQLAGKPNAKIPKAPLNLFL